MKIENGDETNYVCDWCGQDIVDASYMDLEIPNTHWCSTYCAMKWASKPRLATINGERVI